MALIDYPAVLPFRPLSQGYRVKPHRPHLQTEWDEGSVRKRRRYRKTQVPVTLSLRFKPEEKAVWDLFYQTDLNQGVNRFNLPVYLGDGFKARDVQILDIDEDVDPQTSDWIVSLSLLAFEYPLTDNTALLGVLNYYGFAVFPVFRSFHNAVHEQYPRTTAGL